MNEIEKQEHIQLIKKRHANTFWPLTGSKDFYFYNVKNAEEITNAGKNNYKKSTKI